MPQNKTNPDKNHGKNYRNAIATYDRETLHTPADAVAKVKSLAKAKFDETVELAVRLGLDPRKTEQSVRGTVSMPSGTGKTVRIAVFAAGDAAKQARDAGADIVGSDDLAAEIEKGKMDFDIAIATPDMMPLVGKLGRALGPRGLMPNPKTGIVTLNVGKAVEDIKGGKIEFRVDKHSNLHFIIGKASFTEQQLVENYAAALDEVLRVKPSSSKGRYIKKAVISTTMGVGIQVDPNKTRNLMVEDED